MKKKYLGCLLATVLVILSSCAKEKKAVVPAEYGFSSDTLALINDRMQSYIDEGKVSCISVTLIKDNVEIYREEFGYLDLEDKQPINENTIFRIYSMTKPVTAAALMILYDEGKFKLDDKVSDYIPEFENTMVYTPGEDGFTLEPQVNELTVRHLLTHTSGIVYGWTPNSYVDSLYRVNNVSGWDEPIGDKVKKLAKIPFKSQPGTKWEYGLSIDVIGYLVEVLSGMKFDKFLKARLFEPLDMPDTDFYVPESKHDRLAYLYFMGEDGKLHGTGGNLGTGYDVNEIYKKPTVHFSGGGGLVSTIGDYTNFCKMLLNGGKLNEVRVLKESTVEKIMSDQLPENVGFAEGFGFGLAGSVDKKTGEYAWAGAASTNFWIDPSTNTIILAFTQLMPAEHSYAYEFRNIVLSSLID